ncbi:MAG: flagellin FliC [Gammaproteobacteria bacterium]|nr:flagellin FliC [Gammaproteobacteria bacterium]
MANVVNTNIASINTQRSLASTQSGLATAMQRLSSGLRINSAKDDSAGLAIAKRLEAQVSGLGVAERNASDGISMAQTAEGAMIEVGDMMNRMRDLAVQSANGTNTAGDMANLDAEFQALNDEIARTFNATEFNGKKILDADATAFTIQVGANNTADNRITLTTTDMNADAAITAMAAGSIDTQTNAQAAIDLLDTAIDRITTERGDLGAVMNRFEHTINNLQNAAENQAAASSRITDADFAKESAKLSRQQVLSQAATAMLSQANAIPQNVLGLLR